VLTTNDSEHEIEQLRSEVSELRVRLADAEADAQTQARAALEAQAAKAPAAPVAPPARRRMGWRGPVATVLTVLGCVLAPISVIAVWSANQVSDTSRHVASVSPLISQPAVRSALTDRISTAVNDQVDVQGITKLAAAQLSSRACPGSARCCRPSRGRLPAAWRVSFTAPSPPGVSRS
jgi:cytochrome c-type biogenesis protein CcmH/NrfG